MSNRTSAMSDAYLSRGGPAYARGYRDAENGRPNRNGYSDFGFGHHDYDQGYKAGLNDVHWEEVYAGRACDIKTRRCGLSNGRTFDIIEEGRRIGAIA